MCPVGLLWVLLWVLLSLVRFSRALDPGLPRISFPLNSARRPLVHFNHPGIHNTTTLLLSNDGSTLFVGARDAVLSLDVSQPDVIRLKNKREWRPSDREIKECHNKGKDSTVDCPNFIRVLQFINSTHLYACGSHAYNPHDTYLHTETLSMSSTPSSEVNGRCPYNPFQRNTAITIDGELFTGTTSDFMGVKPGIFRHLSRDGRPDVSQDSSFSLLADPTFVSSSFDPADGKLYFFFTEEGKEYTYVNNLRVARVAQVCKDDVGGQRTLQRRWTSFAKAPILCQIPKQLPFNILQDMFALQPPEGNSNKDTLFYGIFTSQWSMGSGPSAVCTYKMEDMRTVFTSEYKKFDTRTQQWSPQLAELSPLLGKCRLQNATDADLEKVKRNFLTHDSVRPVGGAPVVMSAGQRYSRVVAMTTQAANNKEYSVLFLLTESGFLHKVVLLDQGPRVIEEVQVFTQPELVKTLLLAPSKGVVYVGTSEGLTAVPLANCPSYPSCPQCVQSQDPFCSWDHAKEICTSLHSHNMGQDVETGNVTKECLGSRRAAPVTEEVYVHLNNVVKLPCQKPSNLAIVNWTSAGVGALPQNLFLQSADGSLAFFSSPDTLGAYSCVSEEGGYQEDVAAYTVIQKAPPRTKGPIQTHTHRNTATSIQEETDDNTPENTGLQDHTISPREPSRNTEEDLPTDPSSMSGDYTTDDEEVMGTETTTEEEEFTVKSPNTQTRKQQTQERSYHSELVVVSLLLAACVCLLLLGGLYRWHQRRMTFKLSPLVTPEGGAQGPQESVPSLSPELKVE
ncbi:semaphorin-4A [Polymixia lowei]